MGGGTPGAHATSAAHSSLYPSRHAAACASREAYRATFERAHRSSDPTPASAAVANVWSQRRCRAASSSTAAYGSATSTMSPARRRCVATRCLPRDPETRTSARPSASADAIPALEGAPNTGRARLDGEGASWYQHARASQELTKKEKIKLVRSLHAHPPKLSYRLPSADDRSFGPISSTRDETHAPSSRRPYYRRIIKYAARRPLSRRAPRRACCACQP